MDGLKMNAQTELQRCSVAAPFVFVLTGRNDQPWLHAGVHPG
jgi:hypothetical protein